MRTIYIYLSWTGWIWFVIAMTYLIKKNRNPFSRAPEGTPAGKRGLDRNITEAERSNEQCQ